MKLYINTAFEGYNPVGTAAIVFASSKEEAADMLNTELELRGLPKSAKAEDMVHVPNKTGAIILMDGDY